jgi:hypothetical protein
VQKQLSKIALKMTAILWTRFDFMCGLFLATQHSLNWSRELSTSRKKLILAAFMEQQLDQEPGC